MGNNEPAVDQSDLRIRGSSGLIPIIIFRNLSQSQRTHSHDSAPTSFTVHTPSSQCLHTPLMTNLHALVLFVFSLLSLLTLLPHSFLCTLYCHRSTLTLLPVYNYTPSHHTIIHSTLSFLHSAVKSLSSCCSHCIQ